MISLKLISKLPYFWGSNIIANNCFSKFDWTLFYISKLVGTIVQGHWDNVLRRPSPSHFAGTLSHTITAISNPINIRTKGRKPKNLSNIYANCKGKKRQITSDQRNKENNSEDEDHEELLSNKRLWKALQDNSNTGIYEFTVWWDLITFYSFVFINIPLFSRSRVKRICRSRR